MSDEAGALGMSRAGAAFAARRRELGISQRKLASMKVITPPALIAFEKGRTWPRERTRAMLEEAVQWPAGSLARLRAGGSVSFSTSADAPEPVSEQLPAIAGAVNVAMSAVTSAIEALPADDDPGFTARARSVLGDLRQLESITAQAVRSSQGAGGDHQAPGFDPQPLCRVDDRGARHRRCHGGSASLHRPPGSQPVG